MFKEFDKVLVRCSDDGLWESRLYDRTSDKENPPIHWCQDGGFYTQCIPYNEMTRCLIGTSDKYVESYEPVCGDFVRISTLDIEYICIYKDKGEEYYGTYAQYCMGDDKASVNDGILIDPDNVLLPASDEERNLLLLKLHEIGKSWNPDTNVMVDYKWKPRRMESVYIVMFDATECRFVVNFESWNESERWMVSHYLNGLVTKFRNVAETKAEMMNKNLLGKGK